MGMDGETREAFASLFAQMSGLRADITAGNVLTRELVAEQKQTTAEVKDLKKNVTILNQHVFGSDTPPSNPPIISTPIVKKISSSELEVDSLKAQMIVVEKKVDKIDEVNNAQNEQLSEIKTSIVGFTGSITKLLNNPKVIAVGRIAFAGLVTYAIARGWIK